MQASASVANDPVSACLSKRKFSNREATMTAPVATTHRSVNSVFGPGPATPPR
jgi:hypothetical protein